MSSSGGVALVNNILQCAKKTFARTLVRPGEGLLRLALPPDEFGQQLAHLRHLLSKVKASDLGLDRSRALHTEYVPYGRNRYLLKSPLPRPNLTSITQILLQMTFKYTGTKLVNFGHFSELVRQIIGVLFFHLLYLSEIEPCQPNLCETTN